MTIITFSSFVLNNPSIYNKLSDHLGLLTGYIAISYLSSTFLNMSWYWTFLGQIISTLMVVLFFVFGLKYELTQIAFGLGMHAVFIGFNSYFHERNLKNEFIKTSNMEMSRYQLK